MKRANGMAMILAATLAALSLGAIEPPSQDPAKPGPFWQDVPAAAFKFELVPIPASADGKIKPFYMSRLEITWEAFDVFVYRLDLGEGADGGPDAVTRPSKPYLPPDRGFGHEGFAAISMSFHNAREFCKWLSEKSGRKYRLATEAEWEHAARAGAIDDDHKRWGQGVDPAALAEYAVFAENAEGAPKPVGKRKGNAWGLQDMLGNVAEWCTAPDGAGVTKGGSYKSSKADLSIASRATQDKSWNASDPQIPKSKWWLSDGPFVGFRVVCEMTDARPSATTPARP